MHPYTLYISILLFSVANVLTTYLYLYPVVNGCAFPEQPAHTSAGQAVPAQSAPFRLLALGDPQLEGSSSLLDPEYLYFPSIRGIWQDVRNSSSAQDGLRSVQAHVANLVKIDIPVVLRAWQKRLDLFGNDFYLAHIYRMLHWFTNPSHTVVLGDLIGSQWVDNAEFERRGRRYWGRVFARGERVEDNITHVSSTHQLGDESDSWVNRVINVAGNHDIGYAGDVDEERMERFERVFGKSNWETRFTMPVQGGWTKPVPELRLVILNSLNMDGPVLSYALQGDTYRFLNDVVDASRPVEDTTSATILLTHLPLHKDAGICVDSPMIKYHEAKNGGGIKEQNHLSYDSSKNLLSALYGMSDDTNAPAGGLGRNGVILTGHDHEGCDVYHHLPVADIPGQSTWTAEKWNTSSSRRHASVPGIREITVRSMMGDFGGNAGLFSAWYDVDASRWEFGYATCVLGKQHFWWAVHILDIVAICMCIYVGLKVLVEAMRSEDREREKEKTQ